MLCSCPRFLVLLAIFTGAALGQSGANEPPSKTEITELLNKATDKVESFEEAIKLVKPDLDKIDAKLAANYLDAASTARLLIKAAKEKGASAYSLVGLLATLDDLSLDAEKAAVFEASMSALQHPPNAMSTAVLTAAATGCNDIAELIMHATLRYVYAEEEVLGGLLAKEK